MSDFLKNLQNAVNSGDFNSEAAKRIIQVDELSDKKINSEKLIENRLEKAGVKVVTEEEAAMINTEYEKQMNQIKETDLANTQLANLIEIEDMVKASINDMLSFVGELEDKLSKEFEDKNPSFGELYQKIEAIKSKYNSINNK